MKSILISLAVAALLLLARLVLADGIAPVTVSGGGAATSSPLVYLGQTFQIKQFVTCAPRNVATGAYGCSGLGPGTSSVNVFSLLNGSGAVAGAGNDNYNVVNAGTSGLLNNTLQFASTAAGNSTSYGWAPAFYTGNFSASTSSNARIWIAFVPTASFTALAGTPATLTSAATTLNFAGIAYDSGVSTSWLCCAGNGVNYNCASTGVAATSTLSALGHTYGVSYPATGTTLAGPATCSIDGVGTSYSATTPAQTYLPTSPVVLLRTLAASAITATYGWLTMETQ